MATARPFTYNNNEGKNADNIIHLSKLINIPKISNHNKKFTGGNMFGGNTKLFKKIFLKHTAQISNLLSKETGKIDDSNHGTYCHSLERIFGYVGQLYNYKLRYAAPSTFNIFSPNIENNKKYLRYRIVNNSIYCVDQANIYGKVVDKNSSFLRVKWLHVSQTNDQFYISISNNSFINSKYCS